VNWFLRFLINAIVFYLIGRYIPGFNPLTPWMAIVAAIIFGLVNVIIGPILRLISLPLTLITLGAFSFVINYILFAITTWVLPNFHNPIVLNPWLANLIGAVIMMVVSAFTHMSDQSEARRSA
jgi:putative membrane protein